MQSDRWIEKDEFRSETKLGILTQSENRLFDPNVFDRAIRSAHPVQNVDVFDGMRGSDCSIAKMFFKPTTSLTSPKNTQSHPTLADARLTAILAAATAAAAAAAATHCEAAWHILFYARQHRLPSSDSSSACCR